MCKTRQRWRTSSRASSMRRWGRRAAIAALAHRRTGHRRCTPGTRAGARPLGVGLLHVQASGPQVRLLLLHLHQLVRAGVPDGLLLPHPGVPAPRRAALLPRLLRLQHHLGRPGYASSLFNTLHISSYPRARRGLKQDLCEAHSPAEPLLDLLTAKSICAVCMCLVRFLAIPVLLLDMSVHVAARSNRPTNIMQHERAQEFVIATEDRRPLTPFKRCLCGAQ